jgi:uncharacterized protein DUF4129
VTALLRDLPAADDVRSALDRVFARPEFQPPQPSSWDRFREGLWELARRILRPIFDAAGEALGNRWVAWIVVLVLGSFLVWLVIRTLRSVARSSDRVHRSGPAAAAAESARLAAEPHLRAAAEHASGGRFLEAAHALYLGAVLWLDEAGHARYEQSKTGEDYVREIGRTSLASPFRAMLRTFYPVAFGGRAAARETWDRMRAAASEMGVPA